MTKSTRSPLITAETSPPGVRAFVLWNYNCAASRDLVNQMAADLYSERYGYTPIDPNDPEVAPKGVPADWYPWFDAKISSVPFVIAVLSPELTAITPTASGGLGLVGEMLRVWDRDDPSLTAKLVPILLDCEPDELRVAPGGYEQVQDIVVPFVKKCDPIRFASRDRGNGEARRAFTDAVARRLGVVPR